MRVCASSRAFVSAFSWSRNRCTCGRSEGGGQTGHRSGVTRGAVTSSDRFEARGGVGLQHRGLTHTQGPARVSKAYAEFR